LAHKDNAAREKVKEFQGSITYLLFVRLRIAIQQVIDPRLDAPSRSFTACSRFATSTGTSARRAGDPVITG
jgi:hypothetical protein